MQNWEGFFYSKTPQQGSCETCHLIFLFRYYPTHTTVKRTLLSSETHTLQLKKLDVLYIWPLFLCLSFLHKSGYKAPVSSKPCSQEPADLFSGGLYTSHNWSISQLMQSNMENPCTDIWMSKSRLEWEALGSFVLTSLSIFALSLREAAVHASAIPGIIR